MPALPPRCLGVVSWLPRSIGSRPPIRSQLLSRTWRTSPFSPLSPRWISTTAAELDGLFARVSLEPQAATDGYHIIHSVGRNPYANLAIEHRLFQRAHPETRLLMLYRNTPCVVIGRNQNPWTEVNLGKLKLGSSGQHQSVQLVRRRSGGGAVYHDAGNANWSVHVPSAVFDRDQHALMVARALQRLGVASAHVNERHDIVVAGQDGKDYEYKVSGSAYKLTRRRALHHGTCLLGADLEAVSDMLHAPPAAPYLKARGVASVRSPVQNVTLQGEDEAQHDPHDHFGEAVAAEFQSYYGATASSTVIDVDALAAERDAFAFDPPLAQGYAELRTADWLFGQTPQFTFSTQPTAEDLRQRPARPARVPASFAMSFTARHGQLHEIVIAGLAQGGAGADVDVLSVDNKIAAALDGQVLYKIRDWRAVLAEASPVPVHETHIEAVGSWLNELFGVELFGSIQ